jgi:hypothetical protein
MFTKITVELSQTLWFPNFAYLLTIWSTRNFKFPCLNTNGEIPELYKELKL